MDGISFPWDTWLKKCKVLVEKRAEWMLDRQEAGTITIDDFHELLLLWEKKTLLKYLR